MSRRRPFLSRKPTFELEVFNQGLLLRKRDPHSPLLERALLHHLGASALCWDLLARHAGRELLVAGHGDWI